MILFILVLILFDLENDFICLSSFSEWFYLFEFLFYLFLEMILFV